MRVGLAVIAWFLATNACADTHGPQVDTPLPSTHELGSLSVEESAQLCRTFWEELAVTLPPERKASTSCERFAIALSSSFDVTSGSFSYDRTRCEQRVDECSYSQDNPDPSPAERCDGRRVQSVVADCQATVGDYERCATGVLDQIDWEARELTCAAFGDGTEAGPQVNKRLDEARDRTTQACAPLQRACPWLAVASEGGLIRVR